MKRRTSVQSVQTTICFVPAANALRTARSTASVYYQNVRGLRTKVDEFRLSVLKSIFETWHDASLASALLFGLLLGDFNQPLVCWSAALHDPDLPFLHYEPRTQSALFALFTDVMHHSGLSSSMVILTPADAY